MSERCQEIRNFKRFRLTFCETTLSAVIIIVSGNDSNVLFSSVATAIALPGSLLRG